MPSQGVDLVRQGYIMARAALSEKPEVTNVEDRAIPGPAGDIPVRIYTPAGEAPYPILVYYHGGGWVIGDLETSDGISRAFANAASCIVVSVDYRLAPEQASGGDIDARSDLYGLGVLLYELVTGRPPFVGDDPNAIIYQHINTKPESPLEHNASVPPSLERLIMRLLAKPKTERPSSAEEVLAILERVALDEGRQQKAGKT